jgi:hypothetical protein
MNVTSSILRKFTFQESEDFKKLYTLGKSAEINLNFNVSTDWSSKEKTFLIKLIVSLNKDSIIDSIWQMKIEGVDAEASLKQIIENEQINGTIIRILGTLVNTVNWVFMNTGVGPIPIHSHNLMGLILQSLSIIQPPSIESASSEISTP